MGYAEKQIEKYLRRQSMDRKCRKQEHPNFPVSVVYRGVKLSGIIKRVDDPNNLFVELQNPKYGGESLFSLICFAVGHQIFDDDYELTEHAIEAAQRVLTWIYSDQKHAKDHKARINLAKRRNSQRNHAEDHKSRIELAQKLNSKRGKSSE